MQIIVASDSHGNDHALISLLEEYPNADYFLHCGDLESMSQYPPFQYVRGNNDYYGELPDTLIVEAQNHRILVTHSHMMYHHREEKLAVLAKEKNCDIVCYGHTHIAKLDIIDGITILNPGSLWRSRDGRPPSYAIVTITGERVDVEFKFLEEKKEKNRFFFW